MEERVVGPGLQSLLVPLAAPEPTHRRCAGRVLVEYPEQRRLVPVQLLPVGHEGLERASGGPRECYQHDRVG